MGAQFSTEPPGWDGERMCDGHRAEDRAQWVVDNCGLTLEAARQRVMREFPTQFGPQPEGGGASAGGLGGRDEGDDDITAVAEREPVADADPALLVWSDEFETDGPPDPTKWCHDVGGHGWGNGELQHYTRSEANACVRDGVLRVRAVCRDEPSGAHDGSDDDDNEHVSKYTSARLTTKHLGDWRYGRFQARVRLRGCRARGVWPAVWMLPTDSAYGPWPRSGEIDAMEHVGFEPGRVHTTAHTQRFNHLRGTQVGRALAIDVDAWHVFEVIWSAQAIEFVVDGRRHHRFDNAANTNAEGAATTTRGGAVADAEVSDWEAWPFDRPFHLILNVAVGGAWGGQRGVDEAAFRGRGQVMEVAWVRVYREAMVGEPE